MTKTHWIIYVFSTDHIALWIEIAQWRIKENALSQDNTSLVKSAAYYFLAILLAGMASHKVFLCPYHPEAGQSPRSEWSLKTSVV